MLLYFLVLHNYWVASQNLVPNGSFESHVICPNGDGQLSLASPWFSPTNTSTDLFDSCSSQVNVPYSQGPFYSKIYAKDGKAYCGMYQYNPINREYAQVQLNDSLKDDRCYFVEFFGRVQGISSRAINNIGAHLSAQAFTNFPVGPAIVAQTHITRYGNPILKDTLTWTQFAGIYNPVGGEKYIAIGNFNTDQNTDTVFWHPTSPFASSCYYFIDAVSVFSINASGTLPWSYRDTTVTIGDSVYIGNYLGGTFNASWYDINGNLIKSGSGLYVKPITTTSYVVEFTLCNVTRKDTVKVTVDPTYIDHKNIESIIFVHPNPANDFVMFMLPMNFNEPVNVQVINNLGLVVKDFTMKVFKDEEMKLNTTDLINGSYYIRICSGNRSFFSKAIINH